MLRGMGAPYRASFNEIHAQIGTLASRIPALRQQYPDPEECLAVVRQYSDEIQARAEYDDELGHSVYVEINHMLIDAGLVAPEERQF
jgi:hypothetical protein